MWSAYGIPSGFFIFQFEHHPRCIQLPREAPNHSLSTWGGWLFSRHRRADSVSDSVALTVRAVRVHDCIFSRQSRNPPRPVDKAVHYFWTLSHCPWTNLLSVWMARLAFFNAAIYWSVNFPAVVVLLSFNLTLSLAVCCDYGWCFNVNTFGDSLEITTWSRAWIIEALLWINQKRGCSVDALALVVVMVDGFMWLSGRGASCLPSHHTPGPESHLLRKRRMGGFQCTSLFASASKKDFHAMLVCVTV